MYKLAIIDDSWSHTKKIYISYQLCGVGGEFAVFFLEIVLVQSPALYSAGKMHQPTHPLMSSGLLSLKSVSYSYSFGHSAKNRPYSRERMVLG